MQNFPYDENTPETAEETQPPKTKEEFDISSFDFTIADPGEIKEFSEIGYEIILSRDLSVKQVGYSRSDEKYRAYKTCNKWV